MHSSSLVRMEALKADGTCYRWWVSEMVETSAEHIVYVGRAGQQIEGPEGGWVNRYYVLSFAWFGRPYNINAFYDEALRPLALYANVASPLRFEDGVYRYVDYELDVVQHRIGQPIIVEDEDEFQAAVKRYGYSPEFQAKCYETAAELKKILANWQWDEWRWGR